MINSLDELEKSNLSDSEFHLVMNHANMACDLVKNQADVAFGADEIVRHHHGVPNGVGFSNQIEKLPLSSKIFVVAHCFALELLRYKELGGDPRPVIGELYKRYVGPDNAHIISALERAVKRFPQKDNALVMNALEKAVTKNN